MEQYWSDDIENVLESIRHNASVMSDHHKKNYAYYKEKLKFYKIPVIIISGINSVVSVGLQPYMDQGAISAATCLLSLVCGIIGSIELFLRISDGMETELAASKDFYLLAINIYKTLTLERKRRHEGGKEYLDHVYNTYTKLIEDAQVINTKIRDKLADVPVAGGKAVPMSPSPVCERPRETKTGLNIRNRLFGPKKVPAPSEDVIVDRLFARMAASANSPSITPPPPNDYGMMDMMKQFQNQSDAMTRQMREMQSLLPKTADGLVDKTLSDLKDKGSDIAGLAIDVGNTFTRNIEDARVNINDALMDTVEEGRGAFIKTIENEAREVAGEINGLVNQGKEAGKELVIQGKEAGKELVNQGKEAGKELVNQGKEAGKELVNQGKEVVNKGNEAVIKVEKAVKEANEEDKRRSTFSNKSESSGSDKKVKK